MAVESLLNADVLHLIGLLLYDLNDGNRTLASLSSTCHHFRGTLSHCSSEESPSVTTSQR